MKKMMAFLVSCGLIVGLLTGCGGNTENKGTEAPKTDAS